MERKRPHPVDDLDPDYEDVADQQNKRQRQLERDGQEQPVTIHPAVKGLLGKAPLDPARRHQGDLSVTPPAATDARALPGIREEKGKTGTSKEKQIHTSPLPRKSQEDESDTMCSWECGGRGRFKEKRRIIIGNVSRYILTEKRDAGDRATHKWMVYVRGSKERPDVSSFIKKVWFFLHPSYSPNDLVEVSQEPFHLIRRGWGEFPIRVQLHFLDPRNKRVDIIHHLKVPPGS
ncbi:hypothetical protein NP493_378g03008 [Ridgeia piscesae]|uniref:YEATS domain-containing protein n=1 Tax=Ridgeia piscesae TaxID=27915 RepID=A0AAD9L277_RIDPI|nr:hypothetical protein NP493_378g03008 [Ridgeia piscesae]